MKQGKKRNLIKFRYCLNWGCLRKNYKEVDNKNNSCRAHSGVWDHGSTGTRMKQYVREFSIDPKNRKNLDKQTIMWEPHWTCCRKDWKDPGKLYFITF